MFSCKATVNLKFIKVIVNPSYKGLSRPRPIVNPMLVLTTMSINPCLQGQTFTPLYKVIANTSLQGQTFTPLYKVIANTSLQGHNLHLFTRSNIYTTLQGHS